MHRIAASQKYACPEPILVIVAGPPVIEHRLSVTIHPRNAAMVSLVASGAEWQD
jgi:hypothetical protein